VSSDGLPIAAVCHRCERIREPGHPWIVVAAFGVRPWICEFCTIECLALHFEVPDYSWVPR